jgi:hypothetical protein
LNGYGESDFLAASASTDCEPQYRENIPQSADLVLAMGVFRHRHALFPNGGGYCVGKVIPASRALSDTSIRNPSSMACARVYWEITSPKVLSLVSFVVIFCFSLRNVFGFIHRMLMNPKTFWGGTAAAWRS